MRIFLDANILFSAAKSDGAIRTLLALAVGNGHELCADQYVLAEARRNLELKGGDYAAQLERLLAKIQIVPVSSATLPPELEKLLPQKDQPVLSAAISLGCDALVTGDLRHFGPVYGKILSGVTIHSPRSLWEAMS